MALRVGELIVEKVLELLLGNHFPLEGRVGFLFGDVFNLGALRTSLEASFSIRDVVAV